MKRFLRKFCISILIVMICTLYAAFLWTSGRSIRVTSGIELQRNGRAEKVVAQKEGNVAWADPEGGGGWVGPYPLLPEKIASAYMLL